MSNNKKTIDEELVKVNGGTNMNPRVYTCDKCGYSCEEGDVEKIYEDSGCSKKEKYWKCPKCKHMNAL